MAEMWKDKYTEGDQLRTAIVGKCIQENESSGLGMFGIRWPAMCKLKTFVAYHLQKQKWIHLGHG